MACCLTAPSHYLNQCWLLSSEVLWHSPESNFTASGQASKSVWRVWKQNYTLKITATFPRHQWVNCTFFFQFVSPDVPGYVGFANLPNQVHRKSVKKGFEFTLMVVGKCLSCYLFSVSHISVTFHYLRGGHFIYKDAVIKNKTVLQLSYLYDENPYTCKCNIPSIQESRQ